MIDRYQSKSMKEWWSDARKFRTWYQVECAYLKAYLEFYDRYDEKLINDLYGYEDSIDWQEFSIRVKEYDAIVKHDVIAFLHVLEEKIGKQARLIHVGLTSSDIVDTSFALLLNGAAVEIDKKLDQIINSLWQQARNYKGVLMLGRTHGQAAEPTTFGLKLLSHACEMWRGRQRFKQATQEISVGKFSGAVGVYAHTHPHIEDRALQNLGLKAETVATQVVARDRHAAYFGALACLAGSIERLAVEIRLLMHGQVKEAFEPFSLKQKGSSAMPHKKNPVLSENLSGLMRMMRSYALAAFENQALWHERDISHSSVERIIAPDATSLMEFALERLNDIIAHLVVDKEKLSHNLEQAGDKLYSQGLMLALVNKGMMRQQAYELVQKAALGAHGSMKENLRDTGVENFLTKDEFEQIFSPAFTLRHEDSMFERVENLCLRPALNAR
ncbi:MAG: adenylosuccinate lyase [Myxococcales bacterium]|nr:adenylosuccinate lyase [Myxococcales bacterium]USN51023.1 MAG: adenylosuccinate lyase [Myxococcales bacterium]